MAEFNEYITVEKQGCDEFVEKKSRFIGYCAPVKTADEAMEFVKSVKKKHNDARHNCFAYSLCDGSVRYSDDGEPQGTAGQPILEVLTRSGVTDCVVVVTRYFGGILLGTGGLSRAYTNGAKIGINAANPIAMTKVKCCELTVDYSLYGSLGVINSKNGVIVENSDFTDSVTLNIMISPEKFDDFSGDIRELSAGKVKIIEKGERFIKKTCQI